MANASAGRRGVARAEGLSGVFDELRTNVKRDSDLESLRLGVLLNAVGRRSYGPLLLVVGLFAISPATIVPFMTTIVSAVILLIAVQMALGLKRPWLPRPLLNIRVRRQAFWDFLDRARPTVERVDGVFLRPRLEFLSAPPFVNLVALSVVAAALITFPLSIIPFAPLAPGFAIVFIGLGMTARDGVWLLLGTAFVVGAFWLAWPLVF